jgi:hypothetical protein
VSGVGELTRELLRGTTQRLRLGEAAFDGAANGLDRFDRARCSLVALLLLGVLFRHRRAILA